MPVFTYTCSKCHTQFKKLVKDADELVICTCNSQASKEIPSSGVTLVYDVKDRNRGKHVKRGVEKQLRKRMVDHHDRFEIQEKIDRHGLETAEKHKWTKNIKKL